MCVLQVVAEIQSGEADEKAAAPEALQQPRESILQATVDSPVANVTAALTPSKDPRPLFSPVSAAASQTPQSAKSVSVQHNESKAHMERQALEEHNEAKARMERQALEEIASEILKFNPNQPIAKLSDKDDERTQAVKVAIGAENAEDEAKEMARLHAVADEMGEDRLGASILLYPILI
jgi:hypothetical protein